MTNENKLNQASSEELLQQARKGKSGFEFWISIIAGIAIIMMAAGKQSTGLAASNYALMLIAGILLICSAYNFRMTSRMDAILELIARKSK